MRHCRRTMPVFCALGVLVLLTGAAGGADEGPLARVDLGSTTVSWTPIAANEGFVLTVSKPDGTVHRQEYGADASASFEVDLDGSYTYELRAIFRIDDSLRESLQAARQAGEPLLDEPATRRQAVIQSGGFRVLAGTIVQPQTEETQAPRAEASPELGSPAAPEDFVINDDLIVIGSACVGFDCVNGESFGFDTLRLKENNLRIKAQDTSSTASFPTNDWQITFNDSSNGGANKFSIDDIDGGRTPFTIEASAPSHSLYVDDGGRLGLGTSTPVVEAHIVDGDTPTLRLEQDGSSGFSAQTWDVAGNEANFFIRDVTNGSRLPFKIRPNTPTDSLVLNANGYLGVGHSSTPSGKIHIRDATVDSTLLYLENTSGQSIMQMVNGFGDQWAYRSQDNGFGINYAGNPGLEFRIAENGNVFVNSVMVHSSRELKENFRPVVGEEILQRVAALPISEWNYKTEASAARHIGPVAEDFQAVFGLSRDDENVSLADLSGIALSSIQALYAEAEEREAQIERLEQENQALASRLQELEIMVRALSSDEER